MKNLSQDWDVLDLTDAESKTLWALIEGGTQSVSGVARRAGVARTTVDAALRRLRGRKLARPVRTPEGRGHRRLWKASRPEKVNQELNEAAEPFVREEVAEKEQEIPQEGDISEGIEAEELGIHVFRGKHQVLRAYDRMLDLSGTERIYTIQGNRSAEAAMERFDTQYLFDFYRKCREAGVVMEGINGEYVLDLFHRVSIGALQSYKERTAILSVLPGQYLDFDMDVVVVRDTALFINVSEETVIMMKNPAITTVFRCLVALLRDTGRRIDLNEYIRNLIAGAEG